ncbi:KR domain superfamily [Hyaloraphidium curvatum]|nr:KR domain superfamily [Hyaloraphidium curvatum]
MSVVITGTNKGIGLQLAADYAAAGEPVVAACRAASDALLALGVHVVEGVDVGTDAGAQVLADALEAKGAPVKLLVCNAGTAEGDTLETFGTEEMLREYNVNAVGAMRTVRAALPQMGEGGKVAFITSRAGSIGDGPSGGNYAYRASKAAMNMLGRNLASDLKARAIAVCVIHPGMAQTDLLPAHLKHMGIPVERSTAGIRKQIERLDLETTGNFWHFESGDVLPW